MEKLLCMDTSKIWIKKDGKSKKIFLEQLEEFESQGWERGKTYTKPTK